jgi:hypothetical protein
MSILREGVPKRFRINAAKGVPAPGILMGPGFPGHGCEGGYVQMDEVRLSALPSRWCCVSRTTG